MSGIERSPAQCPVDVVLLVTVDTLVADSPVLAGSDGTLTRNHDVQADQRKFREFVIELRWSATLRRVAVIAFLAEMAGVHVLGRWQPRQSVGSFCVPTRDTKWHPTCRHETGGVILPYASVATQKLPTELPGLPSAGTDVHAASRQEMR